MPKADDAWARSVLATVSDGVLLQAVAASIAKPKVQINSSFVLHAPLELLARAWLLRQVPPDLRDGARRRIGEIAVRYTMEGPEIASRPKRYLTADRALRGLSDALQAGDADAVDGTLLFLLPRTSVTHLRGALVDEVLPCLGAAAHAPILLMMLTRAEGALSGMGALLRSPLRAIALQVEKRLTWMDNIATPPQIGKETGLFD